MIKDFLSLGVDDKLVKILEGNGIKEPTPIQVEAIPKILKGKDIIGQAQTGTGKTLAFLLPMMEKIDSNKTHIQSLILTPTRELAIQITSEAKKLAAAKDINILAAYGGQDVISQVKKLKKHIHMVIATPGRLLDHIRRGTIDLRKISMFVLDEADQMLNMGFLNDVEDIMGVMSKNHQRLFFSATMPKEVKSLSSKYMKDPYNIHIKSNNITLDEIDQLVVETTDRGKQEALFKLIDEYNPFMAIIFCRTKRRVSALDGALKRNGYNSDEIHGDLSQAKRERVMKNFRRAKIQYLVATDVAARGIDVEGIPHVFNYDIPEDPESYIHRIGRTGRAGDRGVAVTFVTPKNYRELSDIEKIIKSKITRRKMTTDKISNEDNFSEKKPYSDKRSRYRGDKKHSSGKKYSGGKNRRYNRKSK